MIRVFGMTQRESALTKIIQDESGKCAKVPSAGDRAATEVAHVRVERFGARDHEDDGPEQSRGLARECDEKFQPKQGIKGVEDDRRLGDPPDAEDRERGKPKQHHWTKNGTEDFGSFVLKPKQGGK